VSFSIKAFLKFLLFLVSVSSFAFDCQLPSSNSEISCSKNFRAKNIDDLNEYLLDYKINNGVAKNLIIDFDYIGAGINIAYM
jgi:hypothetical protein